VFYHQAMKIDVLENKMFTVGYMEIKSDCTHLSPKIRLVTEIPLSQRSKTLYMYNDFVTPRNLLKFCITMHIYIFHSIFVFLHTYDIQRQGQCAKENHIAQQDNRNI
jgi:hypothetical protein